MKSNYPIITWSKPNYAPPFPFIIRTPLPPVALLIIPAMPPPPIASETIFLPRPPPPLPKPTPCDGAPGFSLCGFLTVSSILNIQQAASHALISTS